MTLHDLPYAGIGIGFNADIEMGDEDVRDLLKGVVAPFDYIETQPAHFILFPQLWTICKTIPLLLHCSQFSLGTPGTVPDARFGKLTRQVINSTRTPWFAEHISLTRFAGGDTRHFFLPYTDDDLLGVIVENAIRLQNRFSTPLLLENAPRSFRVDVDTMDESTFIRRAVAESHSGFLLDLSSARATARSLGYDFDKYLAAMPLESLVEIHVGDIVAERDVLRSLFSYRSVRSVTIEANLSAANPVQLKQFCDWVRSELHGQRVNWCAVAGDGMSSLGPSQKMEDGVEHREQEGEHKRYELHPRVKLPVGPCKVLNDGRLTVSTMKCTIDASQLGGFFDSIHRVSCKAVDASEIYVICSNVSGLKVGLYHYSFADKLLEVLSAVDPTGWLNFQSDSGIPSSPSCVLVVTTEHAQDHDHSLMSEVGRFDRNALAEACLKSGAEHGLAMHAMGMEHCELFRSSLDLDESTDHVALLFAM